MDGFVGIACAVKCLSVPHHESLDIIRQSWDMGRRFALPQLSAIHAFCANVLHRDIMGLVIHTMSKSRRVV